jgi:hypothetical protein
MQKLLEVVEIWFVLNLAAFAFLLWYRRQNWTRRSMGPHPPAEDPATR